MNFDFSPEQHQLRDSARRFLEHVCPSDKVRSLLENDAAPDRTLWRSLADMGFVGAAIPESYGGSGLGYLELCVIAEELGRVLAPAPMLSSVYLASEFLLRAGSEEQRTRWLAGIASGEAIGTFVGSSTSDVTVRGGSLTGSATIVSDGMSADFAIVAAQGESGMSLVLVELGLCGVAREPMAVFDPSRPRARLSFDGASAESLCEGAAAESLIRRVLDTAAVLVAFEQLGGADRAIELARDFALERMAFGRVIGSFQAIKHKMADMVASATLARSNAYYAAWALSTYAPQLGEAAAVARLGSGDAYRHCAREAIQIHGGMGFTWESDCHLHYRRAQDLALCLGGAPEWEDRLVDCLIANEPV